MKKYFIWSIVGLLAFPTVTLGGTFVFSLIQGKGVPEAIQILANQIDILVGRVAKLEIGQAELENRQNILEEQQAELEKLKACTRWADYVQAKEDIEYFQTNGLIDSDLNIIDPLPNGSANQLDREKFEETKSRYQKYQELKAICEP